MSHLDNHIFYKFFLDLLLLIIEDGYTYNKFLLLIHICSLFFFRVVVLVEIVIVDNSDKQAQVELSRRTPAKSAMLQRRAAEWAEW